MNRIHPILKLLFFIMLQISSATGFAQEEIIVPASDGIEISVERFPANGKYLMLWLAPEYGFRNPHRSLATKLTDQNIEVWQSNIVESLFMPPGVSSLKQLDGKSVADVIQYAYATTGKKIILAGDSYAANNVLLGAHQWQSRQLLQPYLVGAILFSPYTFASIPALGLEPDYLPIVSSSNIPIMIYQAKNSATTVRLQSLLEKLRQHHAPVYTRLVPNVMSLFYEQDVTLEMKKSALPIPLNIKQIIPILEHYGVPAKPVPLGASKPHSSGIDIHLKRFKETNKPAAIRLTDINGNIVVKENFKGKVTVVNFWATWCPPCVEEIPSLNRLKQKMSGQNFELISINFAEHKNKIRAFMKRVNVGFPILLDSKGDNSKKWKVISYPSTFVIDPQGTIKYGVNAAIEWDSPEIIEQLKSMLDAPPKNFKVPHNSLLTPEQTRLYIPKNNHVFQYP